MDREINRKNQSLSLLKRAAIVLAVVSAFILGFYWFKNAIKPKAKSSELVYSTVQRGPLEDTFTASGVVKPKSEVLITSPISTTIDAVLVDEGNPVKRGEVIMRLNTNFASLEYSKLKDELKLKENNVNRLQLSLQKNIRDIELDNQIKDLEVKNLKAQLIDAQRLLAIGAATQEEVDRAEQDLAIANLQKQKLENDLNYRKSSFQADVRNEELQSSIQGKILNELGQKIALTQVEAPVDGVLTWVNKALGTQVNEGTELARISNLSSYQIEGTASDRFANKIQVGLPVNVRIHSQYISGRISQILPNIENNAVAFLVQIDDADSKELKANMRVELFVVEEEKPDALYMAKGSAYKGGKQQFFYVKKGNVLERREFEIGMTNINTIEILSGAQEGDQVVISDMPQYQNQVIISLENLEQ